MKNILEVRKGDFVNDFGVVTDVQVYTQIVATEGTGVCDDNANYARRVAAEMESCYKQVPDRVVLFSGNLRKSYLADAVVNVVPFVRKAAA